MSVLLDEPVPVSARRRWRPGWLQVVACVLIVAGAGVFLYPHAASWFSQKEQSRVTERAQVSLNQPPNNDARFRAEQLERAHAYNAALASGAIFRANENIATGEGTFADDTFVYSDLLATAAGGFMGRLRYDALLIDLPIYHGTADETLERGIGHLEGTSLPVGGVGTRSVLTAHRGLPQATLFNELDRAAVGDTFTVAVLDQVLTYRVIQTQVIEPDETEAILADPDRDLVTLVTCTPLGINSHRILVTGERITPTPVEEIAAAAAPPELPGFPWWAVALGAVLLGAAAYLWRVGYANVPAAPAGRNAGTPKSTGRPGAGAASEATRPDADDSSDLAVLTDLFADADDPGATGRSRA